MRDKMLNAMKMHVDGHIALHKQNIEIYLSNPTAIGEHSGIMESLEYQLEALSKWEGIAITIEKLH